MRTPRWWYHRQHLGAPGGWRWMRRLLYPLSRIWAHQTASRIAKTLPFDPGYPVISVGNLTLGGSGKTPIVRALLARLWAADIQAYGLSRGHGGQLQGPLLVDPAVHTAAEVGDEPRMLAFDGPYLVARDRVAGARLASGLGAEALVLDDAHQNPSLKKALSLVVIDAETRDGQWPFGEGPGGQGRVFPCGPLREPLHAGLARADAVILLMPPGLDQPDAELLALMGPLPVLTARLEPVAPPPPGPQLGFAGIAKPWKVEQALRLAGCALIDFEAFADHAPYTEADLSRLAAKAAERGAGLITTEKDWVRLPAHWQPQVHCWPVQATFDHPEALEALIRDRTGLPL